MNKEELEEAIEEIINLNLNPFYCGKKFSYGTGIIEEKIKVIVEVIMEKLIKI